MKILFVCPSLEAGGAERICLELLEKLDRTRFTPSLAVFSSGGRLAGMVPSDVPVFDMKKKKRTDVLRLVWSLAFRREPPSAAVEVRALVRAIEAGELILTTGIVLQELLQGFLGAKAGEQILDRFASLQKETVNLEQYSAQLLGVVEETLHPEFVSLYLVKTPEIHQKPPI